MRWNRMACVLGVAVVSAWASAAAAEQVENPSYAQWADFGVGSSTTMVMTADAEGNQMQMTITVTLKEVTAEKVVVTQSIVVAVGGQSNTQSFDEEHPKMIDKSALDPDAAAIADPQTESGTQKLTFAGAEHECTWYAFSGDVEGTQAKGKVWTCPKVPGHVVKMQVEAAGQGKFTGTCTAYEVK